MSLSKASMRSMSLSMAFMRSMSLSKATMRPFSCISRQRGCAPQSAVGKQASIPLSVQPEALVVPAGQSAHLLHFWLFTKEVPVPGQFESRLTWY
jgi:hypothetical protein